MNGPDPNNERARLNAHRFNAAEYDSRVNWVRAWRRMMFPGLTEEVLDALAEIDERLDRYGPSMDCLAPGTSRSRE